MYYTSTFWYMTEINRSCKPVEQKLMTPSYWITQLIQFLSLLDQILNCRGLHDESA